MLHSISLSNMFSFEGDLALDFTLKKSSPIDHLSAVEAGERVSKIIMISGHNASGKSNLLKIITFLNWFTFTSFKDIEPDAQIPFSPHFFNSDQHSRIQTVFGAGDSLYKYDVTFTPKRIYSEQLHKKSQETNQFNYLFKREWDEESQSYSVKQNNFHFNQRGVVLRQNASFVSQAIHHGVETAIQLRDSIFLTSNIIDIGRRTSVDGMPYSLAEASRLFHDHSPIFQKAKELLYSLDLGLDEIVIEEEKFIEEGKERSFFMPYSIHQREEKISKEHFLLESSGTQMAYTHSSHLLVALEAGGLAIIDEMDSDLHPDTVKKIIDLFIQPETNPHNAQIIFTSHNHELMDSLNKEQLLLVEKQNHSSDAWLISDMEGVRRDDNHYGKYRSGAYGGVGDLS